MDLVRFGRAVRVLRQRRRWRLDDLADRTGLSRSALDRIELGQASRMAFDDLEKVARALDGQLRLDFRWRGEQRDARSHEKPAAMVVQTVRICRAAHWELAVEATFAIYGERGSIDVFAWHPP